MKHYGLLGRKLSHSFSPAIHQNIFDALKISASYELIEKEEEDLEGFFEELKKGLYSGINVTIPYKKTVMPYLDEIDSKALAIGSVNTILVKEGKLVGYNTDYAGFLEELKHFKVDPLGKNCFVLGTGGASLAIYHVLKDLGGNVYFVSRNKSDAKTISYETLASKQIDILVNTTPVGMYPDIDTSPVEMEIVKKARKVIDIIFNPLQTKLLKDANSKMNGLYMLVYQAIKAEEIWQSRDIKLNIEKIIEELR